jgi:hypothetical protein
MSVLVSLEGTEFKVFFWEVFLQSNVTSASVAFHAFQTGDTRCDLADLAAGGSVKALVGHRLDELANAQAA